MLIRFGLGGQLSGSVGGVVAARNKGGQYLRNRSVPTNPNSVQQQRVRMGFGSVAIAWQSLTDGQRLSWNGYASETPLVNSLGESITVSGFNMFLRTNSFLAAVDAGVVAGGAPPSPGLSSLGALDSAEASVATGLTVAFTGSTAGGLVLASYGPPVSDGVSYFRGPFSLFSIAATLTALAGGAAQMAGDPPASGAGRYGGLVLGQRRFFRIRSIDSDGRVSNESIFAATVVA